MFDRLMGKFLVEEGMLSKGQLDQVYRTQEQNHAKMGVIAVSETSSMQMNVSEG